MSRLLLLPAQTVPPDAPLTRRHAPRPIQLDYTVFRECLRWEFGFTCAICLLHERDIIPYGVEGWGVTQVEHLVPRSLDSSLVGIYSNLLYICRFCNTARSDTDSCDHQGRCLLDPTTDAWADHFHLRGDELVPHHGDRDAEYTLDTYNINDPRKVKLRRKRREHVIDWSSLVRSRQYDISRIIDDMQRGTVEFTNSLSQARADLAALYRQSPGQWVPDDAPNDCRCGRLSARSLPEPYLRQVVEVDVP